MLKVLEEIDVSRALPLTDWSQKEWNTNDGKTVIRRSKVVRSLTEDGELLLIAGITHTSLTSVPELWLLMCKGYCKQLRRNSKHVKLLLAQLLVEYPRLEVRVDMNFVAGMKFARFMGFMQIAEFPSGYAVFEVRN